MDRLSQADAILAAALAYSPSVIVPGHVLSPMDCESTIPVTRMVVRACDRRAHAADRAEEHPVLDAEMMLVSRGASLPRPRRANRSA
jgi:hypothetical protein